MDRPLIRVAAGVIQRDGLILIGQRKRNDSHALKWEFPGGKIELGETPAQALVRELREELEIEARVGRELTRYVHRYLKRASIQLIFFEVPEFTGVEVSAAFEQIAWVRNTDLTRYDFLDGDRDFVRQVAEGKF